MPVLLIPLVLLCIAALWLVLLPLSLRQRYRRGRARRRARGWVLRINAWMLLLSVPGLLAMAWLGTRWSADAMRDAALGLTVGGLLGVLGVLLTRFEWIDGRLHYTPNRWLVLALTTVVAVRIVLGTWLAWHRLSDADATGDAWAALAEGGGLWGVGGLLLGYATAHAWGVHRRRMKARR